MKVALIATGDEVISGQILNRNASDLAKILCKEGVEVVAHFAVADSAVELEKILKFINSELNVDCVFTIGGLGPTRDDLTREVVSKFLGLELVLDNALWGELKNSLKTRGITPREGHKWQCFFSKESKESKESKVFINKKGTAQGFLSKNDDLSIVCVPGPPNEMNSVLENGLLSWVRSKARPSLKLLTWQCINIPESDLADKVENALVGCSYQLGFRAYPPITEVKLWVPLTVNVRTDEWVKKVYKTCESTLYSVDEESFLKNCLNQLHLESMSDVYFYDLVTNGESYDEILRAYGAHWPDYIKYGFGDKIPLDGSEPQKVIFKKNEETYQLLTHDTVVEISLNDLEHFRRKKTDSYALYVLAKDLYHKIKPVSD